MNIFESYLDFVNFREINRNFFQKYSAVKNHKGTWDIYLNKKTQYLGTMIDLSSLPIYDNK